MFPIRFKRPALLCMAMLTVVLSGCGLIQKVVDESKSVASAVFYKQIKILHLDFFSRSALNTDAEDTPLSTMVQAFKQAMNEIGVAGSRQMTVIFQLDRRELGRTIYQLNNEETQRVGVKLAGVKT